MECLSTIIQFIFISSTKEIKPSDMKFNLELQNEFYELNDKNQICFIPKCPCSKIFYCESITLWYNNIKLSTFHFLIYINKENIIIFDMDETCQPSFEILFYVKESKYNPKQLQYKGVEYNQFLNYGNKFRSRIFFANINPDELEYINSPALNEYKCKFKYKTYQAIFRLINEKKFEVTLANMTCYVSNFEDIKSAQLTKDQFLELQNLLLEFLEKYLDFIYNEQLSLNNQQKIYQELKELSDEIVSSEYYYFIQSPNINEYGCYDENKLLYLFQIDLYLNEFIKLKEEDKFTNKNEFERIKKKIIRNHEIEQSLYEKLINDINLNINQKIKIMKSITIFFTNSLLTNNTIFGVSYVNINKIPKNNPYANSLKLLKEIISEITEESRLFEAFMYFDNEIIENILAKNTQHNYTYQNLFGQKVEVNQPQFITEYGISLMTVQEIKSHLLELLPTIIIQIDSNINMRGLFESETKMMVINEYKMFGNNFNINEKTIFKLEPECYIIPISMIILHEILGHAKLRYNENSEKNKFSPLIIRDNKYDFKPQKLIKRIKLFDDTEKDINKGETGRVLEHYISENRDIIQILKEKTFNKEIINAKYWTGNNFDMLFKAIGVETQNNNFSVNQDILLDDNDNVENCDCMFNY